MNDNQSWYEEIDSFSSVFGNYTMRLEIHKHEIADGYYVVISNSSNEDETYIEEIPSYEEAIEKAKQIEVKIIESDEDLWHSINS